MTRKERHHDEQALQAALGAPRYYIDTPALADGEQYFWFPTTGDSMTDNTPESIPSGSLVLGRLIMLNSLADVPLHRPIVIIIDDSGTQFCMLKSGCGITDTHEPGADPGMLCLHSYNKAPWYKDFWMPFSNIKFVFVVERVRLPGGNEFVPGTDEASQNTKGL